MRKFSEPIVAEFSNDGKKLRLVEGLHDYMCDVLNGVVPRPQDFFINTRKECDDLFFRKHA
nr:hypothetical protein [Helicobacter pylori]